MVSIFGNLVEKSRRFIAKSYAARRVIWKFRTHTQHINWRPMLEGDELWRSSLRKAAEGGQRILIAPSMGAYLVGSRMESFLTVLLTLRGCDVDVLFCDGCLEGCHWFDNRVFTRIEQFLDGDGHRHFCHDCHSLPVRRLREMGIRVHRYSDWLESGELDSINREVSRLSIEEMAASVVDGVPLGEHATAGALRFFAKGTLVDEPNALEVMRRYYSAALVTYRVTRRLCEKQEPEVVVLNHGIYVPQGIIAETALSMNRRVVTWHPAYRQRSFIFSEGGTYHHTLMTEDTASWRNMEWSPAHERRIMDYLKTRWKGSADWISFQHDTPIFDTSQISAQLGLDSGKPTVAMLTNVIWDAQLHYPANAFPNMVVWIIETIRYFASRPELQLVIRIHPAEVMGALPSRQKGVDEIKKAFPTLPPNVFVIGPEDHTSTYALVSLCDSALIYGTKMGVELTSIGVPVIVAGEAWIRNKGLTMDANSQEEYFQLLKQLPLGRKLTADTIALARRYAYHFFFRRMIPIREVEPVTGPSRFRITATNARQLLPGQDPGLDVICDGIRLGTPFVYPAEILEDS